MNDAANKLREQVRLLKVEQAAHLLAISKRTLERLIAVGDFPAPLKIGRASRIAQEDVDAFLGKLRNQRASVTRS